MENALIRGGAARDIGSKSRNDKRIKLEKLVGGRKHSMSEIG